MTAGALSRNEKLTMFGLVRFPTFNDRVLAGEIKLKMSTVTAIRNRLKREGWFRTVRIPYLERLGGELLIVTSTRLNILKPREELLRTLREILGSMDDVFFALADTNHVIMFSKCRNYTDAWTDAEKGHQQLVDKGVLPPDRVAASGFGHVLASAIGGSEATPEVTRLEIPRGCVILLCSDGLTKHVSDAEIAEGIRGMASSEQLCRSLLDLALERGGTDNITVLAGRARGISSALT